MGCSQSTGETQPKEKMMAFTIPAAIVQALRHPVPVAADFSPMHFTPAETKAWFASHFLRFASANFPKHRPPLAGAIRPARGGHSGSRPYMASPIHDSRAGFSAIPRRSRRAPRTRGSLRCRLAREDRQCRAARGGAGHRRDDGPHPSHGMERDRLHAVEPANLSSANGGCAQRQTTR
jgi:hypothetical protein